MKRLFMVLVLITLSAPAHPGWATAPVWLEPASATPLVAIPAELPDLYLNAPGQPRIVIGGEIGGKGGKAAVPWNTLHLTKSDSHTQVLCKLRFNVSYLIRNDGKGIAKNFVARLRSGQEIVAETQALTFNGPSMHLVKTIWEAYPGTYQLTVSLDDSKAVDESNESNNSYSFKIIVSDK